MLSDEEREALQYFNTETKTEAMHYGAVLVKLIEKQSKEIEEYKKQLDLDNECEIALNSKVMDLEKEIEELKQKEKEAYIKGTNDAHELCNKKWKNKIKAKIEEYMHKDFIKMQVVMSHDKEALKIAEVLQSLLEKE